MSKKEFNEAAPLDVAIPDADTPLMDKLSIGLSDASTIPIIQIIGCGGGGMERVKLFRNTRSRVSFIDTSKANTTGIAGCDFEVIRKSDPNAEEGSGKIRAENSEEIQRDISNLKQLKDAADITIVVHTFGGGSGSMIGPGVAKLRAIEGRPVVVVGIVDASSKQYCKNAINTLRTYQGIADTFGLYFPIKLFHNKSSKRIVDGEIHQWISMFIDMMTNTDTFSLDLRDKKNFLRPYLTEPVTGVYEIDIYDKETKPDITHPVHSILSITESGDTYETMVDAAMRYDGISKNKWYLSTIGVPVDQRIIEDLEKALDRFETMAMKESNVSKIRGNTGAVDSKTGFCL